MKKMKKEQKELDVRNPEDAIALVESLIDNSTMTGRDFKVFQKALETLQEVVVSCKKKV